jgi:hypothetical protein
MGHSDFGRMQPSATAHGIDSLAACFSKTVPKRNAVAGGSHFSPVWAVARSADSLRVQPFQPRY